MCHHNAIAAERVDRKDLVDLWSIVGLILHPSVSNSPTWIHSHPMGKQLIQTLYVF